MSRKQIRDLGVRPSPCSSADQQCAAKHSSTRLDELPQLDHPVVRLGVAHLHAITEAQCVDSILKSLRTGYGGWVVAVNLDQLRLFTREPWYAALCAQARLVVADGMPLVWASHLQGTPLPERVAGSNLISSLTAAAAQEGRSIFLLGGNPGTAAAAALMLRQRHPTLRVAGR